MYDMDYWKKYNVNLINIRIQIKTQKFSYAKEPIITLKVLYKKEDGYRIKILKVLVLISNGLVRLQTLTELIYITIRYLNFIQIVNHYRNNDSYTTKSGLSRNLRNLIKKEIDIDEFFPKSFDLYDQSDFEDFLEEFKFAYTYS